MYRPGTAALADPIGGARLDRRDPEVPFGATAKDSQGLPIATETGPEVDPYCITIPAARSHAAGGGGGGVDEQLGDGSMEDAIEAVEAVRRSSGGGGSGGPGKAYRPGQ